MKFAIGLLLSFLVGVACRYFDIPVGSPAVVPGALVVLAMTLGYSSTNRILERRSRLETMSRLCGGPTGRNILAEPERHPTNADVLNLYAERLDS